MQEDKNATWEFNNDDSSSDTAKSTGQGSTGLTADDSTPSIAWTASEYVSHEKSTIWYVQYTIIVILIIGVVFIATDKDYISLALLTVFAILFGVFAARKPDVLQYSLDSKGLQIASKLYPITLFKSFGIIQEDAIHSIVLLPLKRFMPSIYVYFAPEDEAKITERLGTLLPQEEHKQDAIDKFMHRIRF